MNEPAAESPEKREVAPPKKKESPNPLPRAVEQGAPVRSLSPMRKLGLPLGIAAAVALGGGTVAYAMSSGANHARPSGSGDTFGIGIPNVIHSVAQFISPEPTPPRLAGEVMPVAPSSSVAPPPVPPTAAPTSSTPKPTPTVIEPQPPPRLGGAVAPPSKP